MLRKLAAVLAAILLGSFAGWAQESATLKAKIQRITSRPEFKHAEFGIEFYDLRNGKVLYALNADKLFVPGSTTKLVTEGTALALLGPDYRFHTRVYRTGPITADGTLQGDLVLVAGGDPNLSARVLPDDTLAYTNDDHVYAGVLPGSAVKGDPLLVLKDMARQVADAGIRQVKGRVLIDVSLFVAEKTEPATGSMISPILVNDNLIDVTVIPATREGGPTSIVMSPFLPYLSIDNKTTTGKATGDPVLQFTAERKNPDGSYVATLTGSVPAGWPALASYKVKEPVRFAEFAFTVALQSVGISAQVPPLDQPKDFPALAASYRPENMVAEHVSPPFSAEIKVTLKASQNLHAATMLYFLGAKLGGDRHDALRAGFALERKFLQKAGLDLTAASQTDGEGGPGAAFTPDFMVRYLAYMAKQPYAKTFFEALPIMGRDGTLEGLLEKSPAAGHVRAKSGTYVFYDGLNHSLLLGSKGLAGYIDTRDGNKLAFAAYVNHVPAANMGEVEKIGDVLGEIVTMAYELKVQSPKPQSPKTRSPKVSSPR